MPASHNCPIELSIDLTDQWKITGNQSVEWLNWTIICDIVESGRNPWGLT